MDRNLQRILVAAVLALTLLAAVATVHYVQDSGHRRQSGCVALQRRFHEC